MMAAFHHSYVLFILVHLVGCNYLNLQGAVYGQSMRTQQASSSHSGKLPQPPGKSTIKEYVKVSAWDHWAQQQHSSAQMNVGPERSPMRINAAHQMRPERSPIRINAAHQMGPERSPKRINTAHQMEPERSPMRINTAHQVERLAEKLSFAERPPGGFFLRLESDSQMEITRKKRDLVDQEQIIGAASDLDTNMGQTAADGANALNKILCMVDISYHPVYGLETANTLVEAWSGDLEIYVLDKEEVFGGHHHLRQGQLKGTKKDCAKLKEEELKKREAIPRKVKTDNGRKILDQQDIQRRRIWFWIKVKARAVDLCNQTKVKVEQMYGNLFYRPKGKKHAMTPRIPDSNVSSDQKNGSIHRREDDHEEAMSEHRDGSIRKREDDHEEGMSEHRDWSIRRREDDHEEGISEHRDWSIRRREDDHEEAMSEHQDGSTRKREDDHEEAMSEHREGSIRKREDDHEEGMSEHRVRHISRRKDNHAKSAHRDESIHGTGEKLEEIAVSTPWAWFDMVDGTQELPTHSNRMILPPIESALADNVKLAEVCNVWKMRSEVTSSSERTAHEGRLHVTHCNMSDRRTQEHCQLFHPRASLIAALPLVSARHCQSLHLVSICVVTASSSPLRNEPELGCPPGQRSERTPDMSLDATVCSFASSKSPAEISQQSLTSLHKACLRRTRAGTVVEIYEVWDAASLMTEEAAGLCLQRCHGPEKGGAGCRRVLPPVNMSILKILSVTQTLLAVLGLVCNGFYVIILFKSDLRKVSVNIFTLGLSFACLILLMTFLTSLTTQTLIDCRVTVFFVHLGMTLTSFMVTAISVDRFIAVTLPLQRSRLCVPKRAFMVALGGLFFSAVDATIHIFLLYGPEARFPGISPLEACLLQSLSHPGLIQAYAIFHCVFIYIIPWLIVCSFNATIIVHLRLKRQQWEKMSTASCLGEFRVNISLVLICILFALLCLPDLIYMMLHLGPHEPALDILLLRELGDIGYVLQALITPTLLLSAGSKYRMVIASLLHKLLPGDCHKNQDLQTSWKVGQDIIISGGRSTSQYSVPSSPVTKDSDNTLAYV